MKFTNKQKGFTIIEVLIVLAIAGLIMTIALVAIPQLQRHQRNTARKSVMSRISTEIGNYASNNNGKIPNASNLDGFKSRYLSNVNINDPSTGQSMGPEIPAALPDAGNIPISIASGEDENTYLGRAFYATGRSCDGEYVKRGSAREFALYTLLEGGAIFCVDNS